MGRPGIVDFDDLGWRPMWDRRAIERFVAAVGLEIEPSPPAQSFEPPRVLVAIVDFAKLYYVRRAARWLGECGHVVLVRTRETEDDAPEAVRELEASWRSTLAALPNSEVIDWRDRGDPAPCRAALARARELAGDLTDAQRPELVPPELDLPVSKWSTWTSRTTYDLEAWVASQLAMRDGRAVLVDAHGAALDLAALPAAISLDYDYDVLRGIPPEMSLETQREELPGSYVAGRDPLHPISWRGMRMTVFWLYAGGYFSSTDHDYPNGPAKKLWGYEDNEPVAVALAPAADMCAQTFDHDVLLTSAVPIGWYRAGDVDVAAFRPDPRRALYYAYTDELAVRLADDLLEEDNRELAPVVVLGPDANARYAVDLRHHVVRITGSHGPDVDTTAAERVGGPNGGYLVCDADHRVVRRGSGVLLGGWFRYATIEDAGWIWREDLATGARTRLCSAERAACVDDGVETVVQDAIREGRHDVAAQLRAAHATRAIDGERIVIAIPGTRNVLELVGAKLRVL